MKMSDKTQTLQHVLINRKKSITINIKSTDQLPNRHRKKEQHITEVI